MINILKRKWMLTQYAPYFANVKDGLQAFVNLKMGQLQEQVSRKAEVRNSTGIKAAMRDKVKTWQNTIVHPHKIPTDRYEREIKNRRLWAFFVAFLLVCETTFNYYAMELLIVPGNRATLWFILRIVAAMIITGLSTLSAERFFHYFRHKKELALKKQFQIYDGKEQNESQAVDTRFWLIALIACCIGVIALSVVRMTALEGGSTDDSEIASHYARLVFFPLISVVFIVGGGALVFEIELCTLIISAYEVYRRAIKHRQAAEKTITSLPTLEANKFKQVLIKEARRTYSLILDFEALFNVNLAKLNLPNVGRQGVEYIDTFNHFVEFVEKQLNETHRRVVGGRTATFQNEFDELMELGHNSVKATENPSDLDTPDLMEPDSPIAPLPIPPRFNGAKSKRIHFEKDAE